jgi:phosphoadenosine phosphosulfate reductase
MTFISKQDEFALAALSARFADLTLGERLRGLPAAVPGKLVFTTSFGLEDQALTHALVEAGIVVDLVTLDTGRLFDETLEVWAETELRYGLTIRGYVPDGPAVQDLLDRDGPLGFRQSVENRQACCGVRKVEPLRRALADAAGWLTGLRADQSAARAATPFLVRDPGHDLIKISPLADWSRDAAVRYVAANAVPYNPLHDRGFLSIGCAPCTRAVAPGEPERSGRWWWETETKKECGLHNRPGHPGVSAEPIPALS